MTKSQFVGVAGHLDYRPWPELRHGAYVLRRMVREQEAGSTYTTLAALVLTAFSVEAFIQTMGPELLAENWNNGARIERQGILRKLEAIAEKVGIQVDYEISPWQEIKALFVARDQLAHAKPHLRTVEGRFDMGSANHDSVFRQAVARQYEPLHDVQVLDDIAARIDDGLMRIWLGAGKDEHQFTMHGFGFYTIGIASA